MSRLTMHDEKSGEQVWQVVNNRSSKFTAVVALEDMWSIKQAENVDQLLCYGYCCLVLEGPQHYELGQVILVHKQPLELAVRNALHVDEVNLAAAVEVFGCNRLDHYPGPLARLLKTNNLMLKPNI